MDRNEFGRRQAAMTANWYEGVKARVSDIDAYIATRHAAYIGRWREAGRFITPGSKLLDVGGGNLFPNLLNYLKELNVDYHYIDVDPAAAAGSKKLAIEMGFDGNQFTCGLNDKFDYPDAHFDVVFSSHCIEHSINLASTFADLNRIVKDGGFLLMAVPLGWEENPEHPYFFSPEQWIALVEDSGFEVRVAQIGREYPETGYDYFIAAKKVKSGASSSRVLPERHLKSAYQFYPSSHCTVAYTGNLQVIDGGSARHMRGGDWVINISPEKASSIILPIFVRHNWSGKVSISNGGERSFHDLFSWFHYIQPCIHISDMSASDVVSIRPVGKNTASWSTEGVFYGYMLL